MLGKASHAHTDMFVMIKKAFTFEHFALMPQSLSLAFFVQDIAVRHIKPRISVSEVFISLFTEDLITNLILSLFVFFAGMVMYIIVFTFDFITGMKASRKEHLISTGVVKGYIKSDKLWSSVWKFFAVIVITSILTVFSFILAIIEQHLLHQAGMLLTLFFFFMVISFDTHSIGENQERRFGKKPLFYAKMDSFYRKVGNLLMFRVSSLVGARPDDFKDNDYENNNR